MEVTLESIQGEAEKVIKVLEGMRLIHVPDTLKDAVAGEWVSLAQDSGEGLLGHIAKDELKVMGQRLISLEKANEALIALENAVVEQYAKQPGNPFHRVMSKVLAMPKFLLTNAVALWGVVLPVVAALIGKSLDVELLEAELARGQAYIASHPNDPQLPRWQNEVENLQREIDAARETQTDTLVSVVAVSAFYITEDLINMASTTAVVASHMKPSTVGRDYAQSVLNEVAMKQRTGPRVRRRKRSR